MSEVSDSDSFELNERRIGSGCELYDLDLIDGKSTEENNSFFKLSTLIMLGVLAVGFGFHK